MYVGLGATQIPEGTCDATGTKIYRTLPGTTSPRWVSLRRGETCAGQLAPREAAPCSPEGARRRDFREGKDVQKICQGGQWVVIGTARETLEQIQERQAAEQAAAEEQAAKRRSTMLLLAAGGGALLLGFVLTRKPKVKS